MSDRPLARLDAAEKALETGQPIPVTKHGGRDRQTRRQRFTSGVAIVLGGLVLIASVAAPLSQLRSLHEIIWWWGLGGQHPWLTWTIRGLSIYGLVAFAGIIVLLGSEGSGPRQGRSKRRKRRRPRKSNVLPYWLLALAIPAFVVGAVMCSILAPFLGLFGLVMAYAVLADVKRLRGGAWLVARSSKPA